MAPVVRNDLPKALLRCKRTGEGLPFGVRILAGDDKREDGRHDDGNKGDGSVKKEDDGEDHGSPPVSPFLPPTPLPTSKAVKSTSLTQITSTAITTFPKTVVVTSMTVVSATSWTVVSTTAPIAPTTSISSSTVFPTTTSILASITSLPSVASTLRDPRKGLDPDGDQSSTCTSTCTSKTKIKHTAQSATATALAENVPSPTSTADPGTSQTSHDDYDERGGLSPTGEHLLIAFGAIGAFIIVLAAVYFIARMKQIDLLSKTRDREFSKGGPKGWYGWRGKQDGYTMNESPSYSGHKGFSGEASEQKTIPSQRRLDAFYSQTSMPPMATPTSAATLSRANTQRQDTNREGLLDNSAPFGVSSVQPTTQSATQAFYNANNQAQLSISPVQLTTTTEAFCNENNLTQSETQLAMKSATQNLYNVNASYNSNSNYSQPYNLIDTAGGLSRQTSDAYDPAQKEVNHMSYLSSLSSGFGDQIIIPEPGPPNPTNAQGSQQNYRQSRKLSWVTSARGPQAHRDTIYTEASMETTPHFRTINSWVAQQTGRVEKQDESNAEVSNMPMIPKPLQIRTAVIHERNRSEDPAFKHHPGDEVELSNGSRVPSTILDKKFGQ